MNSVTAVLLALGLILVVLLVVWLVLRSRTSDLPRGSTPSGPGWHADESAPTDSDRMPSHQGHEPVAGVATDDARPADNTPHTQDGSSAQEGEADATVAEEFLDPGLSELDAEPVDAEPVDAEPVDAEPVDAAQPVDDAAGLPEGVDAARDDTPPRTPTEAFGSADASGGASAHDAAAHEMSVLDDPDVDSTPLFRSIREELLGSPASEEVAPQDRPEESSGQADETSIERALVVEVVAEQPEIEPDTTEPETGQTWSHERRGWDEQAHPEIEGVVETGAVGAGGGGPAAEEEKVLETNEETIGDVVHVEPDVMIGEHPPIRRISELHEVVDGGFGIGSAATLPDGAQPLGHPIKASRDTKTYQDLHSLWYDETEPDVWFLDAGFAERAGFRRAE